MRSLLLVCLPLSCARPGPPPAPPASEPAPSAPAAPAPSGALDFADGNGNALSLSWEEGGGGRWSFAPVQPAQSSSGVYSGGTPASGAVGPEELAALLALVERALAVGAEAGEGRPKGSARLSFRQGARQAEAVLGAGPEREALEAALAALRAEGG